MQASFNHTAEIEASALPGLRLVTVAKVQSPTPLSDAKLETYGWGVSNPATLKDPAHQKEPFGFPFSSTCYFFGRSLHLALKQQVPIGLIASSWGGCHIQPWMRADALAKCSANEMVSMARSAQPSTNGQMFNAMMAPLKDLKLSGMLWVRSPISLPCLHACLSRDIPYCVVVACQDQGEANTNDPAQYNCLFPAAIEDWRNFWDSPTLPFLFVQIGPSSSNALTDAFGNRNDSYGLPLLDIRFSQVTALTLPRVGMASAVDLGDPGAFTNYWRQSNTLCPASIVWSRTGLTP